MLTSLQLDVLIAIGCLALLTASGAWLAACLAGVLRTCKWDWQQRRPAVRRCKISALAFEGAVVVALWLVS